MVIPVWQMHKRSTLAGDAKPVRRHPLVAVLVALSMGATFDHFIDVGRTNWVLISATALCGWCFLWCRRHDRVAESLLMIAIGGLGAVWHDCAWRLYDAQDLGRFATQEDQPVCLRLQVTQTPRWVPAGVADPLRAIPVGDRSQARVELRSIRDGAVWRRIAGESLLVVDGHLLGIRAGDQLCVYAMLQSFSPPSNPGERDFSEYQRCIRRLCRLHSPHPSCVTQLQHGSWLHPRRWLDDIRIGCDRTIWRFVGGQQAGLASAVLLGSREQLAEEETEAFFETGTVHLLAISGMNVAIVAYGLWFVARLGLLSRQATLAATASFVLMYALLTGAEPPVLRAAIFVVTVCLAKWLGRRGLEFNTLAAAGTIVFAINPLSLFQLGTQLSFLAVGVLAGSSSYSSSVVAADPLQRLIDHTRTWPARQYLHWRNAVGNVCKTSFLVWLATTPLVWYQFQLVTPAALALNPMVWLPIALAMYSGFGVLLLGRLVPTITVILGWICQVSLEVVDGLINAALLFPGNHVWLPAPPWWWVGAFYTVVGLMASGERWRVPSRWRLVLLLVWLAGAFWLSPAGFRMLNGKTNLSCSFLAVGHGTCVVVEYPDGRVLLYDGGHMGSPAGAMRSIASFLWHRGIRHLDAVVVSHADTDHFNALPGLFQRFTVGAMYVSPMMASQASTSVQVLRNAALEVNLPIRVLKQGDQLMTSDGIRTEVLHPPAKGIPGSDNANSIVLCIRLGSKRILLTGDMESAGLESLLKQPAVHQQIIMAPHHGSYRSHPLELSKWASPTWVVISGDRVSSSRDTIAAYSRAGSLVFHTDRDGAVQFDVSPERVMAIRHRDSGDGTLR